MNAKGWLTPEEVHEYLRRITGREIDKSTTLLPPFYVDYGKNIHIGKGCWIQQGCTFFDRGGITIGDGVFIGPKVNLITINHDPNPDNRNAYTWEVELSNGLEIKFDNQFNVIDIDD